MKAIGEVQSVAGAHFVERPALPAFLDRMIKAPSVDQAMRERLAGPEPVPRPKALRVSLPPDLRRAMLPDLPANITLELGRLVVRAENAEAMLESLMTSAMVMSNDLDRLRSAVEPPPVRGEDHDSAAPAFLCSLATCGVRSEE